ncbi:MAG: tyrosine-type recombinase/integrase [Rhodobacteraceae bacterium]|nr:tyrosine-type recombinase/integrase [Paracoccaceae bacterium]
MAVIRVGRHQINSSLKEFHPGRLKDEAFDGFVNSTKQFGVSSGGECVADILRVVRKSGALLPLEFAFGFCRSNPQKFATFSRQMKSELNWIADIESQIADEGAPESNVPYVRRILFSLHLSTTIENFSDVTEDVWAAYVTSLKREDTQWHRALKFNDQHKRGFSRLAAFLNGTFQTETGYDKPVKVRRRSNVGSTTGKTNRLLRQPPEHLSMWVSLLEEFRSGPRFAKTTKNSNAAFYLFATWLETYPKKLSRDPKVFLSCKRDTPAWKDHVIHRTGGELKSSTAAAINYMADLVEWYIEEEMVIAGESNRGSVGIPLMTPAERKRFWQEAKSVSPPKSTQATSPMMPRRLVKKVQQILTEDDWKWPKSLAADQFEFNQDGTPTTVWNPVVAYLVYSMTELPWRQIQFKALDSGEGDALRYDWANDEWVKNCTAASGYWDADPSARRTFRGVLNSQNGEFCFYVSTNKTSDHRHRFGEMSGYYVPWKYAPMIELFDKLRIWQQTYNPLTEPTSYGEVYHALGGAAPTDTLIRQIPSRFYLFRDVNGSKNRVAPPTENRVLSFWRLLMDELERRLRAEGDSIPIIRSRNKSGGPLTANFTPHGLRVSGLTAFAEAGVPLEVLSKVVAGHASVLMTIYYVRYPTEHITDLLKDARTKIEANASKEFATFLREASLKDASRIAVANEESTLRGITGREIQTDLFHDTGLGICPFAGTSCGNGLDLGGGRTAAVPGGPKNCVRCRHFVTGEPWLIPLVLNQQRLSGEVHSLARKHNAEIAELDKLEQERAAICTTNGIDAVPLDLTRRICQLETSAERDVDNLDDLLKSMHSGNRLVDQIKGLQKGATPSKMPVLLSETPIEFGEYREGTRFELIDSVLQGSRVYPILKTESFEAERAAFIDKVMYNNSMLPLSMMCLTNDQKQRACDALCEWLLRKVGAVETELLHSGAQTIQELGFEVGDMREQIEFGVSRAKVAWTKKLEKIE